MSQVVLPYFSHYHWPGNVRELENAVERMVILTNGSKVMPDDLPSFLHSANPLAQTISFDPAAERLSLQDVEKQLILRVLEKFRGNQTLAAKYLDISRRTFAYRLDKYGLSSETLRAMRRGATVDESVYATRTVA
jgi:two-component system NtrC family response regulator